MVQSSHVPLAVSAVHFLQPALGFAHRVWDALRSEEYQGDESDQGRVGIGVLQKSKKGSGLAGGGR